MCQPERALKLLRQGTGLPDIKNDNLTKAPDKT